MVGRLFRRLSQVSLTLRFALVTLAILITGMVVIGWWVNRQIESGVMNRTAAVTASFVTSSVAPHLQTLDETGRIGPAQMQSLDRLLYETDLGRRIVSFKVWSPDGRILYSPERSLVGMAYRVGPSLRKALEGDTVSQISDLSEPENAYERQQFSRLQETYTPLRLLGTGEIIGAVEFYEGTGLLAAEIRSARWRTWFIIGTATLAMYVLLVGMVKGASLTIRRQQGQLERRVSELGAAVSHNEVLNRQLAAIAAVATTANETQDLESMLERCLAVTLEQTGMDSGIIRLIDGEGKHLLVASAGGDLSEFPCRSGAVGLEDCPCGRAASSGRCVYLGPRDRQRRQPLCWAPRSHALAMLPLKSHEVALGVQDDADVAQLAGLAYESAYLLMNLQGAAVVVQGGVQVALGEQHVADIAQLVGLAFGSTYLLINLQGAVVVAQGGVQVALDGEHVADVAQVAGLALQASDLFINLQGAAEVV